MEKDELYKMIDERDGYSSLAFPALMRKVYVWMAMALVITAVAAYGVAHSPALLSLIYSSKLTFFGLIIAEVALVMYISGRIDRMALTTATLMFTLYSALNGMTLASIFVLYSEAIITKVFLITAGTFGTMAFVGYTTKSDLTSLGKLAFMGLIGIIIATVRSTSSPNAASTLAKATANVSSRIPWTSPYSCLKWLTWQPSAAMPSVLPNASA